MKYSGVYHLGVHKATMSAAGVGPGANVNITIEIDDKPLPTDTVPPDLQRGIKASKLATNGWTVTSPSHKREYVKHVTDAKKARDARAPGRRNDRILSKRRPRRGRSCARYFRRESSSSASCAARTRKSEPLDANAINRRYANHGDRLRHATALRHSWITSPVVGPSVDTRNLPDQGVDLFRSRSSSCCCASRPRAAHRCPRPRPRPRNRSTAARFLGARRLDPALC